MSSWLAAPIHTDRLILRPTRADDFNALRRLRSDPEVRRYLGGPVAEDVLNQMVPESVVDLPDVLCATLTDGTVMGTVLFDPFERTGDTQISYLFLPEYWGKGYAREAVAAGVGWAFDTFTEIPRLVAMTQAANLGSRKLLEAVGMTQIDSFEMFEAEQTLYAINRPARPAAQPAPRVSG